MPKAQQKCFEDTLQTEQEDFTNGVRQITLVSRSMKMKIVADEQIRAESRFHYNGKWYDDRFYNATCEEERFYRFQGKNELGSFTLVLYRKVDGSCFMNKTYYFWNKNPSPANRAYFRSAEDAQTAQALSLSGKRKRKAAQTFDAGDFSSHRRQSKKISSSPVREVDRPTTTGLQNVVP